MHLESISLSMLGIALGTLAHAAVGALWYSKLLFIDRWMAALGKSMDQMSGNPAVSIAGSVAGSVVTTAILAVIYQWGGGDGPVDGLAVGLLIGVGVVCVEGLNRPLFEGSSWALFSINTGSTAVGFGLAGLVYGMVA